MNPNQMEVCLRNGLEYVIQHPKDGQKVIDNIVLNSDVRKALLLKKELNFNVIFNLATPIA